MDNSEVFRLLDSAISLELQISELYLSFKELFPEYSDFWWQLAIEEKNHAALLKTVRDFVERDVTIPQLLRAYKIEELKAVELMLNRLNKAILAEPTIEKAFKGAYDLELSAGEIHYQIFMQKQEDSKLSEIFRKLNGEDKDHAARIREYLNLLNIH